LLDRLRSGRLVCCGGCQSGTGSTCPRPPSCSRAWA
jgi:hypothetical protein